MKPTWIAWLLVGAALGNAADPALVDNFTGKPRVIVLSDIGNEPDDQMSLVRFLLYSNQFDVEGLAATTSTWQKKAVRILAVTDDGSPPLTSYRRVILTVRPGT